MSAHSPDALAFGVDMGASHVTVALFSADGAVLGEISRAHTVRTDPAGTIALVHRCIGELFDGGAGRRERVAGVGIGVPSPILEHEPNKLSPLLLPGWVGHDIVGALRQTYGVPVHIDNDANLGALGEHAWGAGRGHEHVAFVKLGTGIGLGIIINGTLHRGARGLAGEMSHLSIKTNGPHCACGQRGCLVLLAGSHALIARAEAKQAAGRDAGLRVAHDLPGLISAAVAAPGAARETIGEAGTLIGIGLANVLNLFDPSAVVIGGQLVEAGAHLLGPLRESIRTRTKWMETGGVEVVLAQLGALDVASGAAKRVFDSK